MTTHMLIPGARLVVPESQAQAYHDRLARDLEKANASSPAFADRVSSDGWMIFTHPDSVKGLTPKLNWIFDNLQRDESIVFLDDDLTCVQRCFVEKGEESTVRDPALILEVIKTTELLARDMGAYYFGWASNGGLRYYTGLKPFSLTGTINGCAMGFLAGHGLRFDERIVAKNDYDIAAANAREHRLCFKNCRYTFNQADTFVGKGGLSAHRNSATEKRDVEILRQKWGADIFPQGGNSGTRKRDYAGAVKINMRLPF